MVARLVVQLTEAGHTPVDPVLLLVGGGQVNLEDIVGGVTSGGQRAPSSTSLVHWTPISSFRLELVPLSWAEPDLESHIKMATVNLLARYFHLVSPLIYSGIYFVICWQLCGTSQ